jgi:hypothetical protein
MCELSQKDKAHLMKLASLFNVQVFDIAKKNSCLIRICNQTVWNSLFQLGFRPGSIEHDLKITLASIPDSLARHFIRGIIDGDGSIQKCRNRLRISICGKLNHIQKLSCYISESLLLPQRVVRKMTDNCYEVNWEGNQQVPYLLNWLYDKSSIYLERKYAMACRYYGYRF